MWDIINNGLLRIWDRSILRLKGGEVTLDHYDALWAETTKDGLGTITCFDANRWNKPDYKLQATRCGDTDMWRVVTQELCFKEIITDSSIEYFYMDIKGTKREMSSVDMLALLRSVDKTERALGHVSGVTSPPHQPKSCPVSPMILENHI